MLVIIFYYFGEEDVLVFCYCFEEDAVVGGQVKKCTGFAS